VFSRPSLIVCVLAIAFAATSCVRAGQSSARDLSLTDSVAADLGADGPDLGDDLGGGDPDGGEADATVPDLAPTPCSKPCVLATGLSRPFALAVVDSTVYTAEFGDANSGLFALPAAGGTPQRLGDAGGGVFSMVADGSHVYWSHQGGVRRIALAGANIESVASTAETRAIAVVDGWLYWVSSETSAGIYRRPLSGGDKQQLVTGTPFTNLTVAAGRIYATGYGAGLVASVPQSGGALETVASNQAGPWGITGDASALVWVNNTPGEVVRYPLPSGPATVIGVVAGAHQVALAGDVVYVSGDSSGRIARIRPGGAVEDLATSVGRPKNLVVSGAFIYFTDYDGGRVLRVAR
jgi:hypothetical protein